MLFVSGITADGIDVAFSPLMRGVEVTVYDTERGVYLPKYRGDDCIGYSRDVRLAVRHDEKTAKLYDYIVKAETRVASKGGLFVKSLSEIAESYDNVESVVILNELIDVFGDKGSVVSRTSYDTGVVTRCPLYDLLIFLCREADRYLMHKDVLLVQSGRVALRTVIEFKHSAEADRFFTKMLIESGGKL